MGLTLSDFKVYANDSIRRPVLAVNTARPPSREISTQLLWLAGPLCTSVSFNVLDKGIDALQRLLVLCFPGT